VALAIERVESHNNDVKSASTKVPPINSQSFKSSFAAITA
jgi:hypothetical protein